jgi:hypothetical protein
MLRVTGFAIRLGCHSHQEIYEESAKCEEHDSQEHPLHISPLSRLIVIMLAFVATAYTINGSGNMADSSKSDSEDGCRRQSTLADANADTASPDALHCVRPQSQASTVAVFAAHR